MNVIRSVEVFPLRLPSPASEDAPRYRARPNVRSVYPTADETLLVRIATDDHVGWGEALAPVTPEAPAAVVENLLASLLVGTELTGVRPVTVRLQNTMRDRGHMSGHHADAVAGVDTALWDLWGKIHGLPIHALLGGAYRHEVPVYLTHVSGSTPEERAAGAVEAYRKGFDRMKLHLDQPPADTLANVDAVLDALHGVADGSRPTPQVAVDGHWVHQLGAARSLGRAFDERDVWFFEAPLAPEDIRGHELLAQSMATPVAVGEVLRHRFGFAEWANHRALGIGQPDIGRTGISEGHAIAGVLAANYVPLAPHHSMATGIAYAAGLHVTAAAESIAAMEFSPTVARRSAPFMRTDFLSDEALARGHVRVGDEPGLGVDVVEDAVRDLAARSQ